MANPSLQIGNSNWAIKEDNLLGYSTAGTRFVPQPITMTRESAGTRVNSSGLVETVELLGGEEVTNGDFATDSDWTKGTGWTISGGSASCDGTQSSNSNIYQVAYVSGKTYKTIISVTSITGTLNVFTGSSSQTITITSAGEYEVVYTSTTTTMYLQATASSVCSIDNVSVKESTKNNLARVDYDGTASSLLVEPERTNLVTYSSDFSQWSEIEGALVTSNSVISPSGETNSDKFTFDGTTYGRVEKNIAVTNGNTYTFSVYLKNNNLSDVTQVWLGFSMGGQGEFVTITNEWQRYETVQVANGSNEYPRVQFTGTGSLYAWGSQMEQGSYPTSYIPTDGGTVTRVQDQYSKTGISNLINSEEGVLFLEVAALSNDLSYRRISLNDSSVNNKVGISYDDVSNRIRGQVVIGGVNIFLFFTSTDITEYSKIALKYKANDFALWVDGFERDTDISAGVLPSNTLNNLSFDNGGGGNNFFGKVKQLQVFKTALTDPELVTLTT